MRTIEKNALRLLLREWGRLAGTSTVYKLGRKADELRLEFTRNCLGEPPYDRDVIVTAWEKYFKVKFNHVCYDHMFTRPDTLFVGRAGLSTDQARKIMHELSWTMLVYKDIQKFRL